ncbi:hypothetical protein ACK31U_04070 [Aeromonas caviae]
MADVYLLVCEGASDIALIKAVAAKLSQFYQREIEIQELSPARDDTTKRYPEHGWKEVRSWCRLYGEGNPVAPHQNAAMANAFSAIKQRKNWAALLKIRRAKGLIIQLDTDIAHELKINNVFGVSGDRVHCHNAISEWLGIRQVPQTIHYLLPSFSTESWILALHDEQHEMFSACQKPLNYEAVKEPCDVLIRGGYNSFFHHEKGKRCLDKDYDLYTSYGKAIGDKYQLVSNRCKEFDLFCKYL